LYFDGTRIQNTTSSLPNIATNSNGYLAIGAYRNDFGTIQYNGAVIFGLVRIMPGVDLGAPTVPITTNGTLSGSEIIPNDGVIIRNGNTAATNFNPFTVNINTQRGQESGYATLSPLDNYSTTAMTLSNGNLGFSCASGSDHSIVGGTVSVSSGKWFWEITCNTYVSGGVPWMFGVMTSGTTRSSNLGSKATEWAYFSDGRKANNNTATSYGSTFTTSDVIGVALDMDSGSITFYKNGISQGVAYSNLSGYSLVPAMDLFPGNTSGVAQANFGQKPFKFPPPAGFQPLALANTPRPTIVRPDQFMGVVTYTGNGGTQTISGLDFSPDLIWIKNRNSTYHHALYDTIHLRRLRRITKFQPLWWAVQCSLI
jgi:hypothetical protein